MRNSGILITSGDTGTDKHNACWLIADSKLLQITAGKVATSALPVQQYIRNNSNCCSSQQKYNCWNGVNHSSLLVL
jgi:hypothetical protein